MTRPVRLLATACFATLAMPAAPASAATTVLGHVYQWGSTSCASTGPLGQCTHAYSTAPPPIYGPPCEERLHPGSTYTTTCAVTFDGTSTQVGLPALPATGPSCVGRGEATVEITSGLAGGPFTVPVTFTIDRGIAQVTGAVDAGTTHVEVSGYLIGAGICTGATGDISDLSLGFTISY